MRKVCIVISNLNIGGAELSMYKILFELKNDFNFIVVSLSQGGLLNKDLEKLGIKIYSLDFRNHFLKSVWRLYYVLKNEKPDVVHTWMYHSDLIGGILAKFANIKLIIWGIRNTDLIKGTTVITRLIGMVNAVLSYFIPDKILVVSNSSMIKHSKLKYCTRKMTVIPNGFSSTKKISQKESILFRAQLGFEPSSMLIGSVGRFNEYKDHRTFIEAALILLDLVEGTYNLNFLIIGKNVDNPFLINLIQGTPYVNRFHFFDEINYINKYYSILDIFCLHSISEGFPNVLAEAMLMGCICVSTDVGDSRIILNDDQRIVPPQSPILLAQKIFETISLNKIEKEEIISRNVNRINTTYSLQRMKESYLKIYNQSYEKTKY
jgi:glycosyltransferase involved in cell wall biosynthesis